MPFRQPTFLRTKVRAPIAVPGETVNTSPASCRQRNRRKACRRDVGGTLAAAVHGPNACASACQRADEWCDMPIMNEPKIALTNRRMLLAIFEQHWENARHIKNERLSFTNIFSIVAAGILSLLHSVRGNLVLELSIMIFLCTFSLIGLLTSLRLKAELEECLKSIEKIVAQSGLETFMPVVDSTGALTRYPKFRWLFPVFYSICSVGFLALLLARLLGAAG
jgi:hypothetical protein